MKIVIIADVHGKYTALQKIMEEVRSLDADLLIAPGDFTDMFESVHDFSQMEIADMVVQKLLVPGLKVFCVPGNHDPYEIVDVFEDYGVNLHNKVKKAGSTTFIGWGGAETPFNTTFEPTEEETKEALSKLTKKARGSWVLVTHAPPKGTSLDVVGDGKHVGSAAVRSAIREKKPLLAISAHIHENKGASKIGPTTIFYPGPAYGGFYGVVTIGHGAVECHTKKVSL
ncbi:MAG: metallophosphoesterase [Candidatus Aenigmatarchaeota archaeon]